MDRRAQRQGSASQDFDLNFISAVRLVPWITETTEAIYPAPPTAMLLFIFLFNVRSLVNKMDVLRLRITTQKRIMDCNVLLVWLYMASGFQNHYKSETKSVLWCNNLIFNLSHNVVKWHLGLGWNDYFLKVLHHNGYNNKQVMERSWSCF